MADHHLLADIEHAEEVVAAKGDGTGPKCRNCGETLEWVRDYWKCFACGATEKDHGDFVTRHDAREAAQSKDRVRARIQTAIGETAAAIDAALGREKCPKCGGDLTDEPARKAEPDTGVRAFAGGWACECGYEVEAETTLDDYDQYRLERGEVF